METTKSQLRLRSLDAGGRPAGTGRPSPVPLSDSTFPSRLAQGLAQVDEEEGQARRVNDEKVQDRAAERDAGAERDQKASSRTAEERSQLEDERVAQRETSEREDKRLAAQRDQAQERAEERRNENHSRQRDGQRDEGEEPSEQDTPDEVPSAPVNSENAKPVNAPGGEARSAQTSTTSDGGQSLPQAGVHLGNMAANANAQQAQPGFVATAAGAAGVAGAASSSPSGAVSPASVEAPRAPKTSAVAPKASAPPPPTGQDVERAEAILRQVRVSLQPGLRSATINLQPAELGRMTIRIRVQDGGVNAVIRAESEGTLAVLERHVPELRAMLAQQGFEGAEFDLGLAGESDLGSAQERSRGSSDGRPKGGQPEGEIDLNPMALARPLAAAEGGIDLIA